ncbi:phosphotransferase [Evansella tamaricis]|uniref:Aminoglycoside phosphotransferase family protein n=1 Tax=Evansella tamaricis TaxID=2069301 RepID=A0ABS6JDG3_9BACI|nr:aminoglycoside phosphotransferase family protein [Evansella tamaricis]
MNSELLYKFIIYSEKDNAILVSIDSNSISLPSYESIISHVAVTDHINRYLEKEYNIKTNVIKCYLEKDKQRVYVVELLWRDKLLSSNTRWLHITNSKQLNEFSSWEKEILKNWLSTLNQSVIPWFKLGWRQEMETWLKNEFPNDSIRIEQVRSWERSALYKVNTERESYYFKAVPDIFSHEPSISSFLFENHPSYVPEIINIESQKKWYIMKELQGPLLGRTNNLEYWKQSILRLADIQKHSIIQRNKLEELNCPIRPVSSIIQNYFEDSLNKLAIDNAIINESYNKLMNSIPTLMKMSNLLKSTNLPLSLEHGDFFGGNIIVQDRKPTIYDWSDCSLSHPFLSVVSILDEVEHFFSKETSLTLLEEYINKWSEFNTKEELIKEYELIKLAAPAFYLTVYQTYIFPSFKDNWDKQQIIDGYINKLIDAIKIE